MVTVTHTSTPADRVVLLESLTRHFGSSVALLGEPAAMHAYARIRDPSLRERAKRNKVQLRSAQGCFLDDGECDDYLSGFASLTERAIREGIRRIARR